MNYKIILSYDGTHYFGWQKTPYGPSIEGALQNALFQILRQKVSLSAASRTDRGVHAKGQVVQFTSTKPITLKSINAVLPKDIAALSIEEMPDHFHPTLDATGKEYHYHFCTGIAQLPSKRHYSWHIPYPLSYPTMQTAAKTLIGTHDFSAFSNNNQSGVREIYKIEILPHKIIIAGNSFLYKMVRNIVGTLVYIGCDKIDSLESILKSKDRTKAAVCAPAKGLTLYRVFYD